MPARRQAELLRNAVRRLFWAMVVLASITLLGGVILWSLSEGEYTLAQSVYFALITISTVGYGELPHMDAHVATKSVTAVLIISGIGAIAFFQSTVTTFLIEGWLGRAFRRNRMEKRIAKLEKHFVIAGCGRTGRQVVEELVAIDRPFVVIDREEAKLERMNSNLGIPLLYIVGNATDDHTLVAAGVERAEGVVAALTDDPDNLFVTLSVRALNPQARIVAKVVDSDNEPKLVRAGADTTVNPTRIGGLRLVSELVRPRVTAFLDEMMRTSKNIRFDELGIAPDSHFVGQALESMPYRSEAGVLVVALHLPDDSFVYNPPPDQTLVAGTKLIVMGESQGVEKLRKMISAA